MLNPLHVWELSVFGVIHNSYSSVGKQIVCAIIPVYEVREE